MTSISQKANSSKLGTPTTVNDTRKMEECMTFLVYLNIEEDTEAGTTKKTSMLEEDP